MSHREHILAFKAQPLSMLTQPDDAATPAFNPMGYTPRSDYLDQILFQNFHHATEVIWRDTAEYWPEGAEPTAYLPDHRQVLPYALLTRTVDGEKQYSVYQRVKGIGEERLLKGHSIGWGGHLSGKYVQYDADNGILVWESIIAGLKAEMDEECGVNTEAEGVTTTLHGYIHSFASPVDALHLSVVLEVEVPADYAVSVTEQGLDFKGWYSLEQLKALWQELLGTEVKFESWSNFIIDNLA